MKYMPRVQLLYPLAPLVLAAAMTLLCFHAAGATPGTFFGGIAFAVLIAPPFVAAEQTMRDRVVVAIAVFVGVALAWLLPLRDPDVTVRHWLAAASVLAAVIAAVCGVVIALRGVRLPPLFAAAVAILLFALWLTWPIWLSPQLAGRARLANALAVAHPLFAIDHALADLGPPWTERPLMYNKLSILNQDVSYSLPTTIAWALLLHGTIAVSGFLSTAFRSRSPVKTNVAPVASVSATSGSSSSSC